MSVVGVDFGCLNTVIAVARNRGVDVITNEVSNRATPSLVGFGPKSRYLGEAAKTQEISNLKNTVGSLKRLAGRSFSDPEIDIEKQYVTAALVDVNGQVGAKVNYLGEQHTFSSTALIAMYLTKIKATASAELKLPVSDIVISVPAWFTDSQRRAILDASEVAGLKTLRLMNDTTAAALGYGITKIDLPTAEEKPRRVAFVDIGYSNYTVSIVSFRKGELTVLSTAYDRHFGGRDFDKAIADHFADEFKEKFKIDVKSNPKAYTRLMTGVEKVKKVLSANAQAPLNVESIMNDIDVRGMLKREELEELVKPLLDRVTVPLQQALDDAGLKAADIDFIECIGGCTRVPSLKEAISNFFGKPLSFTLNQDEAVARGCAFACAILSPVFRVRDFAVHDIVSYPIEFTWERYAEIPDEDTTLTVFNKNNTVPSTKILTFYRKESFDLEARYAEPDKLPGKISPWIGRFSVKGVKPDPKGDFMICKLKARLNLHGVLNIESGYYVEEAEVEEPIPEDKDKDENDKTPPKTRKVKKQVKKGDLTVVSGTNAADQASKDALAERENQMFVEDKLVADTEDRKNALEEYIYEMRAKIDDQYAAFASDSEKSKLKDMLEAAENWLYDEGDDTTKAAYVAKHEELRSVAGPIVQRYNDKEEEKRQAQRAQRDAVERAREDAAKKAEEAKKDTEMKDAGDDILQPEIEEADSEMKD
ncbi:adenyl-nucleotide exchange factor sse1 [Orbilia oligospora]|uniref:Adenyl-nucleotide exchange factor sse1 n=1 Tax=Orbilia oligospora TaxID=2813651 RepID=A0A7C8N316_ORBOL|nr:adenyl-nucleotide exchange factor sse1 [Orbilia oligospora]KAF3081472.1 adenyl-nucleotide exchange factor sse1 [Orbilia oligospora]KAF3104603.1 adenyl-nucleotide exchange factor sse1 [Orbilia oligospora]KAF3119979.1 adenyl-nucleotide exchange factor sse1 [Orbilia oligospora]KAF3124689.1 adenyl-nucleotide exchange factor sse1 [Orbilia oligospora]